MYRRLFGASTRWLLCAPSVVAPTATPVETGDSSNSAADGNTADGPKTVTSFTGHTGKTLPDAVITLPFRAQMVELKRAYRGIAQRPSSLHDARTILERAIPTEQSALDAWLNEEHAATALNGASFFEISIPSQAAIVKWTKENIASFKEPFHTASASLSLLHIEERSESCSEFLIKNVVPVLREKLPLLVRDGFHTAVKLFQQLGVEDKALWDAVCEEIKKREAEIAKREANAIRLYSCVARHAPDNAVTRELFGFLLGRVTYFKSYDFTTFLSASERWGKLTLEEALPILQRQGERTHMNNARDLGVCFPAAVRLGRALEAKTLSAGDRLRLAQHLHFVFDACENHVFRCMSRASPDFYWEKPGDVIMALYAYESSQRSVPHLYERFVEYCSDHAAHMTGREVAMALGIQRRAGVLKPEFVAQVLPVIQTALNDEAITVEEASHIAVSLAAATAPGSAAVLAAVRTYVKAHWVSAERKDAAVIFGGQASAKACAAANLASVFTDPEFTAVPLTEVAVRQLVDLRRHGTNPKAKQRIDNELESRIKAKSVTDGELTLIALSAPKADDALRRPAQVAINDMLQQTEWGPYHLDLLAASTKLDKSPYLAQAIELSRLLAVSPQQLVLAVRKLIPIFSADTPEVRTLVTEASEQLIRSSYSASLQLYTLTRGTVYQMTDDWVKNFVTSLCARHAKRAEPQDLVLVIEAIGRHKLLSNDDVKASIKIIVGAQVGRGSEHASLKGLKAFVAALEALDSTFVTEELKAEVVRVSALPPRPVIAAPPPASEGKAKSQQASSKASKDEDAAPSSSAAAKGKKPTTVAAAAEKRSGSSASKAAGGAAAKGSKTAKAEEDEKPVAAAKGKAASTAKAASKVVEKAKPKGKK